MILAQANIATFRWPLDYPQMTGFSEQIKPINELAERSNGFVWRYTEDYQPVGLKQPWNNPLLFFNMSVWCDLECLKEFVSSPDHVKLMRRAGEWTRPVAGPSMAMWWIDEDVRPTVNNAIDALNWISKIGDSPKAFSFKRAYPDPTEPDVG